jgi:VWFA-related protein
MGTVSHIRAAALLLVLVAPASSTYQQSRVAEDSVSQPVYLDVVVSPKAGPPLSGLTQQDFTVLDNELPVTLDSFQAISEHQGTDEAVIVVDEVNTTLENVAYVRAEISKFLRRNRGQLSQPTRLAFLTDSGIEIQDDFTTDGEALSAILDRHPTGIQSIPNSGGVYGDLDRFKISTNALFQLANREGSRPGRKLILWISPGWPLLALPDVQEIGEKQKQQIFSNVVELTTLLCQSRITLHDIDPLGDSDFGARSLRWQGFLKGPSKPGQAQWGDMALQVLALHSGGLVLTGSNDLVASLEKCLSDTKAYYELSFIPHHDKKSDAYHRLEVKVANTAATARTCQGYYPHALKTAPFPVTDSPRLSSNKWSYLDEPLDKLVEQIPELTTLQPTADQTNLPIILSRTAANVDAFFNSAIDLLAQEDVSRARIGADGSVKSSQHSQYDYLIVHETNGPVRNIEEYRTDSAGKRIEQAGLDQGFSLTYGFALTLIHFASSHRTDSDFRYLGQQRVGSRNAYVVSFAELPGHGSANQIMTGNSVSADFLVQGIAWIDDQGFNIVGMRTDLLAPLAKIGLEKQTTKVSCEEVQPRDVSQTIWLPTDVTVEVFFQGTSFRNEHRYTNYRRYRVSSKMVAPN